MESLEFDVAIIGAGLGGIALARFYLDTHPNCRLTIIEKDSEIGGVWNKSRVFDAFWTQSPLRMTYFSDVPLILSDDVPRMYDTFPAKHVTQYLEDYVHTHIYADRPLRDRIWLSTEVTSVEKNNGGWVLQLKGVEAQKIRCSKLAVASGLTSQPMMPNLPCDSRWTAPILHHRDFGIHSRAILSASSPYKHITVIGGGKSAADMIYASVKAKKYVNWIIRKTGEGPGVFMQPATSGRYRNAVEVGATQNATKFNPSGFRPMLAEAQSLHQSVSGRATLDEKLFAADRRYKAWANYKGREGALPSFRELEPSASFFWSSGPVGMIQHDDFWDLVSQQVDVYRSDPIGKIATSIILEDGRKVPTDVIFCGTGWDPTYSFLSSQQVCELGLPHDPGKDSVEEAQHWQVLMSVADQCIVSDYPMLAKPPLGCKPRADADLTPARLYQGIAPLTDPKILFLGRARLSNNFLGAEAQAIWATAYWDGHISLPPLGQVQSNVAYMNAFSRRRYPSRGADGLNFHMDLIWYIDTLTYEAGLTSHRKGWWEDWDEPCLVRDLKDCKDEYLMKYKC